MGDEFPPPAKAGNFADESAKKVFKGWSIINGYDDGYAYPAPVGSFKLDDYRLYDIVGNVWEWCADWYGSSYYNDSPYSNPTGPSFGECRVLRGGSWLDFGTNTLRVAYLYHYLSPSVTNVFFGFRCVSGLQ